MGVCLLQNAVLGGIDKETKMQTEALINLGINFYCLEEDLTMRGFDERDLHPHIQLYDYSDLVDLMMEEYDKVIGAF